MNAALEMIPFPATGHTLWAGRAANDQAVVALRPICRNIGLAWQVQHRRIKSDPILSEGVTMVVTPSQGGVQDTVCLPLDLIPGWLFKIDSRRVKPEIRDTLIAYQRECYGVLAAHFGGRTAQVATPAETVKTNLTVETLDADDDGFDRPVSMLQAQLRLIQEARLLAGRHAALRLWKRLGLPELGATPDDEEASPADIDRFLSACVERVAGASVSGSALFAAYCAWCAEFGLQAVTATTFGRALHGVLRKQKSGTIRYLDVRLKA